MPDAERRAAVRDPRGARPTPRPASATRPTRPGRDGATWTCSRSPSGPLAGRTVGNTSRRSPERVDDPPTCSSTSCSPTGCPLTLMLPSLVPSLGRSDEGWKVRAALWRDPRTVLGGSDAGRAHRPDVPRQLHLGGARPFGARARPGRTRRSRAPHDRSSGAPARAERPRPDRSPVGTPISRSSTPERIASEPAQVRHDLPAGERAVARGARGMEHVVVGGRTVVRADQLTGELAGTLLRSGRDTETVTVPGG